MKKNNKKIDLLIVTLILVITAAISYILDVKPLIAGLLYLLIPSIYLILREKKNLLKIFLAVLILGIIFSFIFDFIQVFNRAYISLNEELVFPWRLFNVEPVDYILGYMLMTLFIIVFYEHFLDDEKNRRISKNLIWALIPSLSVLIFIIALFLINKETLRFPYPYLMGGFSL